MTIVRWDSVRHLAAHQERMNRMLEGFNSGPQEDLARGSWPVSTFTATARMSSY